MPYRLVAYLFYCTLILPPSRSTLFPYTTSSDLDIMMPKLNGLELRKKATLLRPDMRFLFISGYAEDTIGRTAHLPQDAGYLEKPFLPIELARKVRALLNETDVERGSTGKTA